MKQIEVIDSQRMKIMDKLRFHNRIVDALSDGVATSALSNMKIISVFVRLIFSSESLLTGFIENTDHLSIGFPKIGLIAYLLILDSEKSYVTIMCFSLCECVLIMISS